MNQRIPKPIFVKVLFVTLIAIVLLFYFKSFFSTGVYFEDTFLTKKVNSSEIHYAGETVHGSIQVIVKELASRQNSVEVLFQLPNNIKKQYTVNFINTSDLELDIENIKDENGNIVFQGGKYIKDSPFLFDMSGVPFMDGYHPIMIQGENPYNNSYKVSLNSVVGFAASANETVRGEYGVLFIALLVLIMTLIDIRFPLFFFTLRNSLDVKNPEPSEFYITMQQLSWYVFSPIAIIVLLIVAIY